METNSAKARGKLAKSEKRAQKFCFFEVLLLVHRFNYFKCPPLWKPRKALWKYSALGLWAEHDHNTAGGVPAHTGIPKDSEETLPCAAGGLDQGPSYLDINICEIRYRESSRGLERSRSTNLEDTVTTILLFGKDFESFFLIARSYHTIRYLQHTEISASMWKKERLTLKAPPAISRRALRAHLLRSMCTIQHQRHC